MASNFLKRKAEERAKEHDKIYGEGTYGSTADLKQKLEASKKTSTTETSSSTKSGGAVTEKTNKSKASSFLQKKAVDRALADARQPYKPSYTTNSATKTMPSSTTTSSNTTKKYTDYSSAVKYLQDKGVQGASGIMTENEWRRRNRSGGTYQDYLDSQVNKYGRGNIDLTNRPIYKNPDGTISTVASYTMGIDGKHYVLPSIVRDVNGNAKKLETEDDVFNHFKNTGEYLGVFDTQEEADEYAQNLHIEQEKYYPNSSLGGAAGNHQNTYLRMTESEAAKSYMEADQQLADSVTDSVGYAVEKFGRGVIDGLEGITDFVWSVVGSLGWGVTSGLGFFENSWSDAIEKWYNGINEDDITDMFGVAEDRYNAAPDWVKDWGWLPETIGNLVPFMAETYFTAGSTLGDDLAVAGKSAWDAGKKLLTNPDVHYGMSAAGDATERAVEKGANPLASTTYGAAAGALEVATEKLFGTGYAGTSVGASKRVAKEAAEETAEKTLLKKIWDSPARKKVFDIGTEGIEEGIVTFADPALQKATGVDENAEWATWSEYVESGSHGIILAVVMNAAGIPIDKYNKSKVISSLNESSETLNGFIQDDASKLKPLPNNASEPEIIARQKEVMAVSLAFDNAVKKAVQNEQQTTAEQPTETPDTLEQAAMDVVANRNATQTEKTTPISNATATEDSLPIQEENGVKTENKPITEEAANESALDVAQKEAEAKAIKAAFEAGRQNVPREKVNLATLEQEEAYNNGRIEHIKNMPKETPKVPNIDNKTKQAYNVSGKTTDNTKNEPQTEINGVSVGDVYSIGEKNYTITKRENGKTTYTITDKDGNVRATKEVTNLTADSNFTNGQVFTKIQDGNAQTQTKGVAATEIARAGLSGKMSVGITNGQAYVSNGDLYIPVNDANVAKSELGAIESSAVGNDVSKLLKQSSFAPINENYVDGNLEGVGSVRVYKVANGREIAVKKEVAQYLEGYNLEATFRGGKPYAIKATDNNGDITGIAKAIWLNTSGQTYNITDVKEAATKLIDEDLHIDNRTWEEVGNRQVKAFQFLFPEFKDYYTPLAKELLSDLKNTIKGEKIMTGSYEMGNEEWTGVSRYTSDAIARIKDNTNATYDDIEIALNRLINDDGQENVALAKRIELVLDEMLTEGYTDFEGVQIPADQDYIAKKEALLGKTQDKQDKEVSNTDDDWDWLFDSGADTKAVESDNYTSPEYETAETRKPIVATDFKADKQRRAEATEKYGLSHDEANMLGDYVGGQMCYVLNERMINGTLAKNDTKVIDSVRNALLKMPEYSGRTYRNLKFKTEKEYNDFLAEYSEGKTVELKAFTSSSKIPNGYPLFGNRVVHLVIDGVSGRDIADTFGLPRQQEVVYLPDTAIEIKKVMIANDGNTLIFAQEVTSNENTRTKEKGDAVNNRPKTGIHQDINGQGTESDGNARNNNGLQREVRSGNGRDGVLSERGKSAESRNVSVENGNTKKGNTKKEKVVETTTKLNDFGEKIGGARKDQWNSRGLVVDDLESMNDRERDKNVKKDNVWKRPNYRALVEAGGDRGLLWAVNEIRKSLQQNVYYGYNATAETKAEKQKLFIETIRAIQSMAENAKTKADFEAMGEKWLMDNGYLEDTGKTYGRYAYTQKFSQNPALSGSNYLNNIRYLAKNFDNLTNLADRNQFAVDTKSAVPKGFSIVGGEGSVGSKLVNGEWVKDTSYGVAKGRYIIKDGFATREEALEWLKQGIAKKKGKTRFVPQQLLEVHRKGPDYRNSKSIAGQDYIDTFGFKGGEFGNWMSAKDRQVSLDYGFDALKDLADALNIEDSDISFGGNLNIAFGARGQGLSGAAAHYENERRVINLTKMNGAGSLGHEWFHALDDFIGGYTNNYATDKYYSLPEKTKQAIRDLITTMQYKDATQEETDLAKQKRYEQAIRGITYTLENEFGWVKAVEEGTFNEANAKYYKRKPTKNDAKKYRELFNKLIETGENKYVEELSALRKEVNGRVIPKEVRDSFVWRVASLNSAKSDSVQLSRKTTDFYTDSRRFGNLHSKDGDYWDSTVEMSARAFACYVADKTNKQNDYLTAHSDSAITLDTDKDGKPVVVRAYPVGEERVAINKAFDNLIEALKADGFLHERTQTEKPAEVSYEAALNKKMAEDDGVDKFTTNKNTDKLNDNEDDDKLAMWTTNRVGNKVTPKSISEIVATIQQKFGINITTGHIQGKGVLGQYNKDSRGIRTKIANNLPVISHELGHYFERTLDINAQLTDELRNELTSNLDERTLKNYPENKLVREGVAEFTRRFLQNRETAAIDYPLFTDFFLSKLSSKDLAVFEQLADDINAYYSLDADTATSSIRFHQEGDIDLRTPMEKLKEKASSLYQAFVDSNYAIKRFDRATGSNAYMLASNAAYSDAIAGQIVTGDLTDKNGQYVSAGLKTVLNGLDLNNKEEYRLFGEYLTVKHGPERLRDGKRVFADDKKNNTSFMERRQAELEAQYPQFEEISERLYGFIRKFYQTWAVDTGLLPKETLEFLNNRWEYYVPFNRVMEKGKGGFGAKRGFANQNNTLNKTKKDGSGRDIKHPVDNLINNIVRMVNAGVRNNVMLNIADSAEKLGADATFLEQVPMPISVTKVDMTDIKETLTTWLEESDMDATSKDKASGIVNNLDDILLQYGRGKAHGNVVTVLKNGNPQAWKVNDVELLQSLTSLSPKTMDGLLDAIAITSRFMTANITGNNIVWSIFSNLPRDIGTFFTYSKNKNVIKMARGVGSAYLNKVKGDKANPLYKEFLAMGGGKTSAYTADRNLAKDVRKKISGRKFNPNPIDWIGYVSDIVEAGPRFATYKMMREAGMTPQEAFYESMDITTNFRRSGRISKDINKVVPFFNANVQGLDKFRRWITAEEVKGAGRKKAIRNRAISFVAVSAALAAIMYAINNGDDEKEEQYEQLSSFIKNSYWVIPVGDGKYFAIPKPREIGVLSSFFERCMELGIGENDHAFDEFYDYASENFLPAIANDIAQVGSKGLVETGMNIIGSFGMIGVIGYLGANRDFLGRPIVSSSLQNLEPKDQYTDRTSKIAYWLGQAFNGSPEQIDYFFQQILGGWWKGQKALFPVGEKNVDWSLGVGNTYIKDNQYSTDLTNWLYDRADTTAKAQKSNPDDMEKAIAAKWDSNMTDFYNTYNKKAKADSNSVSARSTRQLVLDIIREYQKGIDGDYKTSWQEAVENVCKIKGSTEYMPSVMSPIVTDGNDKKHNLSDAQYVEYQTEYLRLYWETVEETMSYNMTTEEKAEILTAAKTVAKEQATERTLKRIGATSSKFATKYEGVENDTLTEFLAGVSEANADNKVEKKEVVNVITGLDVDNDDAWKLYLSKYDSKSAIEAEKHGIDAKLYMTAVVDMGNIKADYKSNGKVISGSRRAKIEKYLNSVCDSYKEYLFLLGTEYDSIKDDYDYVQYFGN